MNAKGRDPDASTPAADIPFDTLYRTISPFLTRFLHRLRVPDSDRGDVAQEAWLRIFQQAIQGLPARHPVRRWMRGEPDALQPLRRWVACTAYHVVLNYRTRAHRRREWLCESAVAHRMAKALSPAEQAACAQRSREVFALLDRLSGPQQTVIVMRYFEGLSDAEIAQELELPVGTVASRIRQAHITLKAFIERQPDHPLRQLLSSTLDPLVPEVWAAAGETPDDPAESEQAVDELWWRGLLALLLVAGAWEQAAPAATVPQAQIPPVAKSRPRPALLLAPVVFGIVLLAGTCTCQADIARILPRLAVARVATVFRSDGALGVVTADSRSWLRYEETLAAPAKLRDAVAELPIPEDSVVEIRDSPLLDDAGDEDQLRPWFLPLDIRWPIFFWRPATMKPPKPTDFIAPLVALCLSSSNGGCEPVPPPGPDPSLVAAGGAGGGGSTGGAGGTGGGSICTPGEVAPCYTGPAGTEGVGTCKAGSATCQNDGMGYGACTNETTPAIENCSTPSDDDCDGATPVCSGQALWSKQFDGPQGDTYGMKVAIDTAGNVVTTGQFRGTVDFGNGALTSAGAGSSDVFIAKLDTAGNPLWSRGFGDGDMQFGFGIAVDTDGNVLVTGNFYGTIDFGNGPLTSAGAADVFVVKVDPLGIVLWSKRFGDGDAQNGWSVAADPGGNVWVAGAFSGTVDFGGSPLASAGVEDVFVVKLSPSGDHLLSQRFGGPGSQIPQGITSDSAGNVLLTGYFWNTIDFGGGPLQSTGLTDMFVAKLSGTGGHLFSKRFGDAGSQYSHAVALDTAGAPVLAGPFDGSIDFGGGALPGAGNRDVFLAALDASGSHRWSKRFGDSDIQSAIGVAVDGLGNIWMTGEFLGSIDFGNGTLASAGLYDIFLASFDPNGNPLWSQSFGDAKLQKGQSLAGGADGSVVLAGEFSGTIDLGTGPLTSQSGNSTFLAKFTQ